MTTKREIARRWMATESFEWKEGMGAIDSKGRSWRLFAAHDDILYGKEEQELAHYTPMQWDGEWVEIIDAVPDLNDDATFGILYMAARRKHGPHLYTMADGFDGHAYEYWQTMDGSRQDHIICRGATEVDALVSTIDAASGHRLFPVTSCVCSDCADSY